MNRSKKEDNVLILTSTFPRWEKDSTPPFVSHLADNLAKSYKGIYVLAPHYEGAATKEARDERVFIKRFRYVYPASRQDIVYGGGAADKINKTPGYAIKLLFFMVSLFFSTLSTTLTKRVKVINAHWIIPQGFVAVIVKMLTGAKVVVSVHGGDIFGLTSPLFTKIKRFVFKHADAVIVNSSATLEACKEVYPDMAYPVIPMGIDVQHFRPQKASKEFANKLDITGKFMALFVGRLTEVKGCIYLCQAANKFKDDHKDFKVLIVGDGPQKDELEEYVKSNKLEKYVELVGWVDMSELPQYYAAADVFVGPSVADEGNWKEALGLTFVEALSSGLPVIATRTGGISDVVTDGEDGFLVEHKSAHAIYEKLKLLYEKPELKKSFSGKGRERMIEKFSWASVTKRYVDVFDRVSGSKA